MTITINSFVEAGRQTAADDRWMIIDTRNYLFASFEDGTEIYANGVLQSTINKQQISTISLSANDIITSNKPISFVAEGSGLTGLCYAWAGTAFSYSFNRESGVSIFIVAVDTSASVTVVRGTSDTSVFSGTVGTTSFTTVSIGSTYDAYTIESDNPIAVYVGGLPTTDCMPLYPCSTEIFGTASSTGYVSAIEDNTSVTEFSSTGNSTSFSINRGQSISITNTGGFNFSGQSLRLVSDKPIAAEQQADGDGTEKTPFIAENSFGTHFVIPEDQRDFVKLVTNQPGSVVAYDSSGNVLSTTTYTGNASNSVYEARLSGTSSYERVLLVSSVPAHAVFDSATGDEAVLHAHIGVTPNSKIVYGTDLVRSDLYLQLDAANSKSYPGTGTVWRGVQPPTTSTSTQLRDTSSNSVQLLSNNLSFEEDAPSGASGKSIRFNSSDIGIPENAAYLISGDFTIEFWGKFDPTQTFYAVILNYVNDTHGGSGDTFELRAPGGYSSDTVSTQIEASVISSNVTHNDDTWRHYAVVRSGSTITFYVDGVSQGSLTNSNQIDFGSSNQDAYGLDWAATIGRSGEPYYPNTDNFMSGNLFQMNLATTARYTSGFTPSTSLTNDGDTLWFIEAVEESTTSSLSGTLTNGVVYDAGNNGTFIFDGINDYVDLSSIPDSFWQGAWSASFWVNFDTLSTTTSGSTDKTLVQHGTSSTRTGLHICQRNARMYLGLLNDDYSGTGTIATGTWYNVVFTLDNNSRSSAIYINGSLDATYNHSGVYAGTGSNTRLGGVVLDFGQTLDGKIAGCSLYSRVLTISEIQKNFNALRGRYGV